MTPGFHQARAKGELGSWVSFAESFRKPESGAGLALQPARAARRAKQPRIASGDVV
jgi:hypothetical protein